MGHNLKTQYSLHYRSVTLGFFFYINVHSLPERSGTMPFLPYESSLAWADLALIQPILHSWMEAKL